jgi:signal transduction histidine kinase
LPLETESRLGQFTDLMATAIANSESRAKTDRLTEEQAALRRVATLVAKEVPVREVFAAVAEELASVLADVECSLFRDEGDGTASAVAVFGDPGDVGERGSGRGIHSAVSCPVVVRGRVWGAMSAASRRAEAFPPEMETRMGQFADLVATAIANADARAEVERLAQEQAALRRVATLVAEGAPPAAVFDAVATEIEGLIGADGATLCRYESDEEVTIVAHRGLNAALLPPGTRAGDQGENLTALVRRSGQPARIESYDGATGAAAELMSSSGVRASVAAPIVVDGRLWGVAIANWGGEEAPSADSEERMTQFAGLLDTAIANADSRGQLTASRARLLTAGDDARRRVVRDLHDGAQQRLVHTIISLKLARQALHEGDGKAESLVGEALEHAEQGNAELRNLAHGILPSVLTRSGLRWGVDAMVGRIDLPVDVDVTSERFGEEVEASAYFFVAEALTNVVKHAHAGHAEVTASVEDGMLHVTVRDDGMGGADPAGHGLVGIADRLMALGGRLEVESPAGGGTLLTAELPLSMG